MSFNGSGVFNLAEAPFVFDTVISETEMNSNLSDIATGLSNCMTKDGQQTITANIPMNSKKFTDLAVGSAATDSANLGQIQAGAFRRSGTAGGTKNALTINPSPAITAYATGQRFTAIIGGTSSDAAATLVVSGLASPKAIEIDNAALSASVVLVTGKTYDFEYDGTAFQATRLSTIGGDLVASNNLSDVDNAATSATNLGLGTGNTPIFAGINLGDENLNTYKEENWTPVLTFSTAGDLSVAYTVQTGSYIKIGKFVIARFNVLTSAFTHTTASGDIQLTGLPFASVNTATEQHAGPMAHWGGITKANYTHVASKVAQNVSMVNFGISGSGQSSTTIQSGDVPTGGTVQLVGCAIYEAAA